MNYLGYFFGHLVFFLEDGPDVEEFFAWSSLLSVDMRYCFLSLNTLAYYGHLGNITISIVTLVVDRVRPRQ